MSDISLPNTPSPIRQGSEYYASQVIDSLFNFPITESRINNGSYHTQQNNMNRSSQKRYQGIRTSRELDNSTRSTIRSSPHHHHHILPPRMVEEDICTEHVNGVDILVYDPYNPLNIEITPKSVQDLLSVYGIRTPIHNFNLYRRAFVHRSYTKSPSVENALNNIVISPKPDNCLPLSTKSNERLEFIGDGVLECITKYYLYCRFPKENEGFMTEKKIALVKNEAIGRIALEMGLHRWFILSRHAEEKMTRTNIKKLGCLFEAFLGALFLDCNKVTESDEDPDGVVNAGNLCQSGFMCGPGFQFAQIFITHVFDKHIDWTELIQNDDNFKNILQVKIQKEFKNTPEYLHICPYSAEDGYHMGVYICLGKPIHAWHRGHADSVHIRQFPSFQSIHEYVYEHGSVLVFLGEGKHKIKKKAEQIACEMGSTALDRIHRIDGDPSCVSK
jgi:dsRNA-specific ribonuclease